MECQCENEWNHGIFNDPSSACTCKPETTNCCKGNQPCIETERCNGKDYGHCQCNDCFCNWIEVKSEEGEITLGQFDKSTKCSTLNLQTCPHENPNSGVQHFLSCFYRNGTEGCRDHLKADEYSIIGSASK